MPVFTYYMLLQSKPGGGDEAHADLANLRIARPMADVLGATSSCSSQRIRGAKTVVVHVEPDLWGYLEQAGARRARVARSRRSGCSCATSSRRT